MNVIVTIILVLFIPVCILLILMVLLQSGKGGGLSSAFGGMGAQPFLGARGTADFLSKFTIYLAIAFMSLALILSVTYGRGKSVSIQEKPPAATETPAGGKAAGTQAGSTAGKAAQPQTPSSTSAGSKAPSPESKGSK